MTTNWFDQLLFWLSAVGPISSRRVTDACGRLAERAGVWDPSSSPWFWRAWYLDPLHAIGHVEQYHGRIQAVPTRVLWRGNGPMSGSAQLYGAQSPELIELFLQGLPEGVEAETLQDSSGPTAHTLVGPRPVIADRCDRLGLRLVDERGQKALTQLPSVQAAVRAMTRNRDRAERGQVDIFDHRAHYAPWKRSGDSVKIPCLYRPSGIRGSDHFLELDADRSYYRLKTDEQKKVGRWCVVDGDASVEIVYESSSGLLQVPGGHLRLPVVVDRALRLASPRGTRTLQQRGGRIVEYQGVSWSRAREVSRVLGVGVREKALATTR